MQVEDPFQIDKFSADQPIDLAVLLTNCLKSRSLARSLLLELRKKGEDIVERMPELLVDGSFETISELAHELKGSAGILGAAKLVSASVNLEFAASEQNRDEATRCIDLLKEELDRCIEQITTLAWDATLRQNSQIPQAH